MPSDQADGIVDKIRSEGLVSNAWWWRTEHWRPDPQLAEKSDLGLDDTRPKDALATPAVCACGSEEGAAYYAWQLTDQRSRIALCDLMIHDPAVIAAHHGSRVVIAGRCNTVFRSAFTVALPILPTSIVNVWRPAERGTMPRPDVYLNRLIS